MKYACKSKRTEVQRHSDIEDIAIPGGFGEIRALYPLSSFPTSRTCVGAVRGTLWVSKNRVAVLFLHICLS